MRVTDEAIDRIKQMIRYMGSVKVCDDRAPEHPCPTRQ